jgi:N-acetylglucosaminyldiphosphoundecaprenol N-acetyl-beta-D-mannosaminyltransferase
MTRIRKTFRVLDSTIDNLSWEEAVSRIAGWGRAGQSRYVCICNVHSVVTATLHTEFAQCVEAADMATPDGAPVAWLIRKLGKVVQERINGPDLMWHYCDSATDQGGPIFLYGGSPETLMLLEKNLMNAFPDLRIAGSYSPPFRELTEQEDEEIVARINASGATTVWVSLGCPKQEMWMAAHRGRIHAVMVGVGAAFDYHAGTIRRAPVWMQDRGLEWLHRLLSEPGRLWRRYLVTNSLFIVLAARQAIFRTSVITHTTEETR